VSSNDIPGYSNRRPRFLIRVCRSSMSASSIRVVIVTVSDGVAAGEREDRGGPACEQALSRSGIAHEIVGRRVLADDSDAIAELVRTQADSGAADLIVLTGGTGLSPRDRTPEAVRRVIDREAPGLAEKMRADTGRDFAAAYLSRQVVGVRGRTLVVALPGSPKGAADCLHAVAELLPHAIELARGERAHHPRLDPEIEEA
jgi:molybdenum cofactor synthesis domain-containing protein